MKTVLFYKTNSVSFILYSWFIYGSSSASTPKQGQVRLDIYNHATWSLAGLLINFLYQCGPTTFDLQASLQKRDNFVGQFQEIDVWNNR